VHASKNQTLLSPVVAESLSLAEMLFRIMDGETNGMIIPNLRYSSNWIQRESTLPESA
jgi:hypothetical protein